MRSRSPAANTSSNTASAVRSCRRPPEIPQFTGAYNLDGALILTNPPQTPSMANAAQVYHIFDYALFYRNLEQNAKDRINAFSSNRFWERLPPQR
jgi:hypothetical protein